MTAQIHERLILEGEEVSMAFCPPLPKNDSRVRELAGRDIQLAESERILRSTACWRGYQGTWEIKEGKLYLVGLRGRFQLAASEPLFADWVTGVLRIPKGKCLHPINMGFGSVYEQELHVKIEKGIVVKSRDIDNHSKPVDRSKLAWANLPGSENRFDGDDQL